MSRQTKKTVKPGNKFHRLAVLSHSHQDPKYKTNYWKCKCDCGNLTTVRTESLGKTKSCGCFQTETRAALGKSHRYQDGLGLFYDNYRIAKRGARLRNYSWNLTKEEYIKIVTQQCHYCGIPPSNFKGYPKEPNVGIWYNGIDRVVNSIGYEMDNIVSCCFTCNKIKGTMSVDELYVWLDRITSYRKSK